VPGGLEVANEKFVTLWAGGGVARILEMTPSAPGILAHAEFIGVCHVKSSLVCARKRRFVSASRDKLRRKGISFFIGLKAFHAILIPANIACLPKRA
jgi:hypothetical protein